MAEWYTVEGDTPEEAVAAQERLVAAWVDAPTGNLEVCDMLLEVAREQVIAYAPDPEEAQDEVSAVLDFWGYSAATVTAVLALLELDPPADPIKRYVYAQLGQATNLWNAGRVSSDGDTGMDGFVFTPRPLDKVIRSIIRPVDGTPNAGG